MDTTQDARPKQHSEMDARAAFRVFNPVTGALLCLEGVFHILATGPAILIWFPIASGLTLLLVSYLNRDTQRLAGPWWLALPQVLVLCELSIHFYHGSGFAEILMMVGFTFICAALVSSQRLAGISLALNAVFLGIFLALSNLLVWQNAIFVWFLCQVAAVSTNLWRRHKVENDARLQREQLAKISGELAHELNNHLMGVSGGLEMAARGLEGNTAREGLEIATHSVRRIAAVGKHLASVAGESAPLHDTFQLDQHLNAETLRSYLPAGVVLHFDRAQELVEVRGNLYQLVSALGEMVRYAGESARFKEGRWVRVKLKQTGNVVAVDLRYPGAQPDVLRQLFAGHPGDTLRTRFDFGVQFAAGVIQRHAQDIEIGTDPSGCTVLSIRLRSSHENQEKASDVGLAN